MTNFRLITKLRKDSTKREKEFFLNIARVSEREKHRLKKRMRSQRMKISPRDSFEFLDATWLSDFPARLVHPSTLPLYSTLPQRSRSYPIPISYSCLSLHLATPLYYSYRRCKIQTAAQPGYCIRSSILDSSPTPTLYISPCKCVYTRC